MTIDRIREIENKALDIINDVFIDEYAFNLPINITKITNALGLNLKEGKFNNEEIVGAYDRKSQTIYLAKDGHYTRKVFTIAHEIGHFVLHVDKEQETFFKKDLMFVDKDDVPAEQEANCFAASLLMPKGTVLRYFKITKDTETLAAAFGVSYSAMRLRLKNLELVEV